MHITTTTTVRILSSLLLVILQWPLLIRSAPQSSSDIDIDISQQTSSSSNPSCADVAFAHLSCPSPGLCYYSDRSGAPACCPAGESCQRGTGTGSETGQTESQPSSAPAPSPDSDSNSDDETSSQSNSGNSDSSKNAGSPTTGGGSYVGPGAENVVVLMNNSAHGCGWEGVSGFGFALRVVWGWVFMVNVLGL